MVSAPEKPDRVQDVPARQRPRRALIGMIALLVVAAVAVIAWLAWGDSETAGPGPQETPGPQQTPGPAGDVGPQEPVGVQDQDRIRGSGTIDTEPRDVAPFDGLALDAEGTVVLTQSEEIAVEVTTDENLLRHIGTEVRGSLLHIETIDADGRDLDPTDEILIRVMAPEFRELALGSVGSVAVDDLVADRLVLEVSGTGSVTVEGLEADTLVVEATGAGSMSVSGAANSQQVTMTGAGSYAAGDLRTERAEIAVDGPGSAVVWVTDQLTVSGGGPGSISYYGSPVVSGEVTRPATLTALGAR